MQQRIAASAGLFFLAPLIAEFLLGNIAIDAIWVVLFIAPLYGGGALLVREAARHTGHGWPTMILLAFAYALIEEGLVTQSLFNPSYLGFDLLAAAHIPVLGVGAWWTLYVLTIHTVWSIAVPIALVEGFLPNQSDTPWLGKGGLTIAGLLFLLGAVINYSTTYDQERFTASTPQLFGAAIVCLIVILVAFAIRRPQHPEVDGRVLNPWLVGAMSLGASSLFTLGLYLPGWLTVGVWLTLFVGVTVLIMHWSSRTQWGPAHRLALAGGALLTYAWQGFPHTPVIGTGGTVDMLGNAVFALGAVLLLSAATLSVRRAERGNRSESAV